MDEIENKVAKSGLITLDLQDFYPKGERVLFDIKELLWQGLVLKEKDFREFISNNNWAQYENKYVALHCSNDAIIPSWAYLLLSLALQPYAKKVVKGNLSDLELSIFEEIILNFNIDAYKNERIIIKGCSDLPIPEQAYIALVAKLRPHVKSLMFGEACSTVPLFKKKGN